MAENARTHIITTAELEKMSPQERDDAVVASIVRSWDEVPEPFRTEVLDTARDLGQQRRQRD